MRGAIVINESSPKKVAARKLLFAVFLEGVSVIAGILAYALTGGWLWLAIGVLGGLGFALPAIIVFVRASMEERNSASR